MFKNGSVLWWFCCALVASAGLWHLSQRPNHIANESLLQTKYLLPLVAWGILTFSLWLGVIWGRWLEPILRPLSADLGRWLALLGILFWCLWWLLEGSFLQSLTYYLLPYLIVLLFGLMLLLLSFNPPLFQRTMPSWGYLLVGWVIVSLIMEGLVGIYPLRAGLETQKNIIGLFRSMPDYGWGLRPSYEFTWSKEGEFDNQVRINSLGQYDLERHYERQAGRRVVVLGDSFIEALHVPLPQTPTQVAEKCLADTEVLNLGLSATGTGQQWLFFQESAYQYSADVVILGMYLLNDFDDNYRVRNWLVSLYGAYRFDLLADGSLQIRYIEPWQTPRDYLADYSELWRIQQAQGILKQANTSAQVDWWFQDRLFRADFVESAEWVLMTELLRRFKQHVEAQAAEFQVLLLPSKVEAIPLVDLGTTLPEGLNVDFAHAMMLDFLHRDLGVRVIDFYPVVRARNAKDLYLVTDGHFNAEGYQLLGETLCQALEENEGMP